MQKQPQSELPPANIEAEDYLLGACFIDASIIPDVLQILRAGDFYREANGWLFQAMADMSATGKPIETAAMVDELQRRGQLADIGGPETLARIMHDLPNPIYALHYARLILECSKRRQMIAALTDASRVAFDATMQPADVYRSLFARVEAITASPGDNDGLLTWVASFDEWNAGQLERMGRADEPKMMLPWRDLSFVRPLSPGQLVAVAALSGVGKTTFAENCAEHWARHGFPVAFFHFELDHQVMSDRRMVRMSGESMATIQAGELTPAMQQAEESMRRWLAGVHYVFCDGWPMARVCAQARVMIRQHGVRVIVIDYLQKARYVEHVRGLTPAQMRGQDVEMVKSLAERERVPAMLLSQLNREANRESRKTRHTIRDTGELDEKANVVITLDRKILDSGGKFGGQWVAAGSLSPEVTVRVDKQTLGRTGEVGLVMNPGRYLMAGKAD